MNTDYTGIFEKSPELAEIMVSYKSRRKDIVKITGSHDAFVVLYPLFDTNTIGLREEFLILLLNRANNVLGWFKLSFGGTTSTVVDPKIIFMLALKTNACSIILCHNHPSGNLKPSDTDISITNRIKEAAKLLEMSLLDHLIISPEGSYYSFANERIL